MKNKSFILILSALLLLGGCSSAPKEEAPKPVQTENETTEKEEVAGISEETEEEKEEIKEEIKKDETQKPTESAKPQETPVSTPSATPTPSQTPASTTAPAPVKKSVEEVMNNILSGVNTPDYELTPIDKSNFSYYMFVDFIEGAKGVSADALISSTAHSVCLIELPDGENAKAVASRIKQNADPAKWICVEAESVETAVNGNMVLLVMSDSATTNAIVNNFKQQ